VLALGAATQWDSVVFNMAAQFLIGEIRAGKLTFSERARLEAGLEAVSDHYHPRVDPPETHVNLGLVLNELGLYAEAAGHFAQSWQLFGASAETAFKIAMVSFAADDLHNTRLWLAKTIELNPQHITARGWLAQLAYNESVTGSGSEPTEPAG
jgi:Flp pilus assembly protein TadD